MSERITIGLSIDQLRQMTEYSEEAFQEFCAAVDKQVPEDHRARCKEMHPFQVYQIRSGVDDYQVTGPGTIGTIHGFGPDEMVLFAAHIVCPDPSCDPARVARTKQIHQPIGFSVHINHLEPYHDA